MNKRIILSLGMIVFVAAVAIGATGAFFSDSETSTGNTFTAGAIDLKVDSQSHYAGLVCSPNNVWALEQAQGTTTRPDLLNQPCTGTWTLTDLGPNSTFFDFGDLKPGDSGENTLSLHVFNNDAYACAVIDNLQDNDNDLTEPEGDDGDVTPGPIGGGELSSQLRFFAWADLASTSGAVAGDNIWQVGEPVLFSNQSGPASDVLGGVSYPLYTPNNGSLPAESTSYIGLYWCYGSITVGTSTATLACSGSSVNNLTQTDSMSADITFYVEQSRNNANFTCPTPQSVNKDNEVTVEVNANDLALSFPDIIASSTKWLFYNDTNDTVMTLNQFSGLGGVNDIVAGPDLVGAAQMTLDTGVNPRYNIATYKYKNVKLADIGSFKYRIYDASASSETPFLHFNVDFDNSDAWQKRLIMIPTGVAVNTWTTVDAISGGAALWTYSGATWPITGQPGTTAKTWAQILIDYPNAETRSTDSFLGVRVGHPGPTGENSFVDWVEFDGETTDFEI